MDKKPSNLGRPPSRLRYFKSNERSCPFQKANVVRNIEDCFNELDSSSDTGSELSALSPLSMPGSPAEDAEVQSILLLPMTETSENPLCSEKNPPKHFVPGKTSSPVGQAAENIDGHGEVPESNAVKIAQSKKAQLTRKNFDESSELESPPKKFVLEKCPRAPTGSKQQRKEFCPSSSDEEFLSLQSKKVCVAPVVPSQKNQASDKMRGAASKDCEGEPSTAPVKSTDHPLLEKHSSNVVSSEVKHLEEGRACSAFVLKLKDTGRSKSIGKEASPVPASPHIEADEDFIILEDENLRSPHWFSIPRRAELKRSKLLHEEDGEAEKHNTEGNSADVAADQNHIPPQNSKNKEKHSKGTKRKKTDAPTTAEQKTQRKITKGVDKRPLDIPTAVQSKTTQNCLEGQERVVGNTEMHNADIAEEDDVPVLLPSPCSASIIETDERVDNKNKTNGKQKEKCPKGSRRRPMRQKKVEVRVPSSRPVTENDAAPEGHKLSKRKRRKPVSYWLANQEEQTDVCDNEIHCSVAEKKRKQSQALESPETERAVGRNVDGILPKLKSVYRAGKKTPVSKKKLGSRRHARKSKKTVTDVLGLPDECVERVVSGGSDDQGYDIPSPYPDQHHAPTPDKKQKKSKGKQLSRHQENLIMVDTSPTFSDYEALQTSSEMGKRNRRKPGSWWLVNEEEQTGNDDQREIPARRKPCRRPEQPRLSTHQSPTSCAQSPSLERQQRTVPLNRLEGEESDLLGKSSPQLHRRRKTLKKRTANALPKSSQKALKKSADIPESSPKLRETSIQTLLRRNGLLASENVKTSLASFGSIFTPVSTKTIPNARHSASRKTVGIPITELPLRGAQYILSRYGRLGCDYCQGAPDYLRNDQNANSVGIEPRADISPNCPSAKSPSMAAYVKRSRRRNLTVDNRRLQFNQLQSEVDACHGFISGPSSMIEVDEGTMASVQNDPPMSEFQMCASPLRPIALQVDDREDIFQWLKNLWSSPDGAGKCTPEDFQWYAHHGRAMGHKIDLLHETFSNGKILLGSYMAKPVQVDNNAVHVYNILTSAVCVTINGEKTELFSGETFMVPCGHAYGIRNLTAEPAVLLYHRMVAESPGSG